MALADLRPKIVAKMIELGFVEWEDAFPIDNIPATIEDQSFHISFETVSTSPANQQHHSYSIPFVLRVLRRGFRYPVEAVDACMVSADSINGAILSQAWRLSLGSGLKTIVPTRIDLEPLSSSNDNVVVLSMRFEAVLISYFP